MEHINEFLIKSHKLNKIFDVDFFSAASKKGNAAQQLLGITDDILERYYLAALYLLSQKQWEAARDAFLFLTFLNPCEHNFWMGLGISEQWQRHYEAALLAYGMGESTDPQDPAVFANSFQCNAALGNRDAAARSLKQALECCGENDDFAGLKAQLLDYSKQLTYNV